MEEKRLNESIDEIFEMLREIQENTKYMKEFMQKHDIPMREAEVAPTEEQTQAAKQGETHSSLFRDDTDDRIQTGEELERYAREHPDSLLYPVYGQEEPELSEESDAPQIQRGMRL